MRGRLSMSVPSRSKTTTGVVRARSGRHASQDSSQGRHAARGAPRSGCRPGKDTLMRASRPDTAVPSSRAAQVRTSQSRLNSSARSQSRACHGRRGVLTAWRRRHGAARPLRGPRGRARADRRRKSRARSRSWPSQHHPDRNPDDPARARALQGDQRRLPGAVATRSAAAMYDRFGHRAEEPGLAVRASGPFAGRRSSTSATSTSTASSATCSASSASAGATRATSSATSRSPSRRPPSAARRRSATSASSPAATAAASGAAAGTVPEPCSACNGRGRVRFQQGIFPIAVERTCSRCQRHGQASCATPCARVPRQRPRVAHRVARRSRIPPGVEPGATKLVTGAGNRPRPDRPAGDLEITIHVKPHPFFRRAGDDVVCTVPVTFAHAALGGEVEVPTLDGKGKLRVPAGTQPGHGAPHQGQGHPAPRRARAGRPAGRGRHRGADAAHGAAARAARGAREGARGGRAAQRRTFMEKLRDLFG